MKKNEKHPSFPLILRHLGSLAFHNIPHVVESVTIAPNVQWPSAACGVPPFSSWTNGHLTCKAARHVMGWSPKHQTNPNYVKAVKGMIFWSCMHWRSLGHLGSEHVRFGSWRMEWLSRHLQTLVTLVTLTWWVLFCSDWKHQTLVKLYWARGPHGWFHSMHEIKIYVHNIYIYIIYIYVCVYIIYYIGCPKAPRHQGPNSDLCSASDAEPQSSSHGFSRFLWGNFSFNGSRPRFSRIILIPVVNSQLSCQTRPCQDSVLFHSRLSVGKSKISIACLYLFTGHLPDSSRLSGTGTIFLVFLVLHSPCSDFVGRT